MSLFVLLSYVSDVIFFQNSAKIKVYIGMPVNYIIDRTSYFYRVGKKVGRSTDLFISVKLCCSWEIITWLK